jgi:hypothetical protein
MESILDKHGESVKLTRIIHEVPIELKTRIRSVAEKKQFINKE